MDYFETGYKPSGFVGGWLAGENADIAHQRQQQDLERYALENVVKQQQAQQAQQEMGSVDYNQSRLAGLIGQGQSAAARGTFDTQTLQPKIGATNQGYSTQQIKDRIVQQREQMDEVLAAYEGNQGNPVMTLEALSDPQQKQSIAQAFQAKGPQATMAAIKQMRDHYTTLEADSAKQRNAVELQKNALASNEKIQSAHDQERLAATNIRASATQAAQSARGALQGAQNPKELDATYMREKQKIEAERTKAIGEDAFSPELDTALNARRQALENDYKTIRAYYGSNVSAAPKETPQTPAVNFTPDSGFDAAPHAQSIKNAIDAINMGKDPDAVVKKLRDNGILVNLK
jgi:hypothetical protein